MSSSSPPIPSPSLSDRLQHLILREFQQSVTHEETLLSHWEQHQRRQASQRARARARAQARGSDLPPADSTNTYAAELRQKAEKCRKRRQYLLDTNDAQRFIPEPDLLRADAIIKSWEDATAEEDSNNSSSSGGGNKDDTAPTNTTPAPPIARRPQRYSTIPAIGCLILIFILNPTVLFWLISSNAPRHPTTFNTSIHILNLDAQPTLITPRLSTRLTAIEQTLHPMLTTLTALPEAHTTATTTLAALHGLHNIWIRTEIFDEPLLHLDLHTASTLYNITHHHTSSRNPLNSVALAQVLPSTWAPNRPALRLAAELEAHMAAKKAWRRRARAARREGEQLLQMARDAVLTVQTAWLSVEARDATLGEKSAVVVRAWQETAEVCAGLEAGEKKIREDVGALKGLMEVWSDGGEGEENDDDVVDVLRRELLGHGVFSLRAWTSERLAAAECRVQPDCQWI